MNGGKKKKKKKNSSSDKMSACDSTVSVGLQLKAMHQVMEVMVAYCVGQRQKQARNTGRPFYQFGSAAQNFKSFKNIKKWIKKCRKINFLKSQQQPFRWQNSRGYFSVREGLLVSEPGGDKKENNLKRSTLPLRQQGKRIIALLTPTRENMLIFKAKLPLLSALS